jgi:hypothetical protein
MVRQALLSIAVIVPALAVHAQDVGERPAFEVASVKPSTWG